MSETYENIDDWEIIKEHKKERLKTLNKLKKSYKKKNNKFKREIKDLEAKISDNKKKDAEIDKDKDESESKSDITYRSLENRQYYLQGELIRFNNKHDDYQHDINLSQKRHDELEVEIDTVKSEIETIKAKIKELKAKQQPKKKMAGKKTAKSTEECPKKCRIDNIKIDCDHSSSRGFTLNVAPHEPGMEIPYLHVLSSHASKAYDVISVDFGGHCDHGKKSSCKDSTDHKQFERIDGNTEYCPRVSIKNDETSTDISRPSKVKFAAALSEDSVKEYIPGTAEFRLVTDLIFKKDKVIKEYDLQFESCKGNMPYRARVIAHPAWKWNLDFSFSYKAATKLKKEKSIWETITDLVKTQPKTYDDDNENGGWEAAITAGYTYDIHNWTYEHKLSFEQLSDQLGGTWSFLGSIHDMFSSVNGFFEMAEVKNKAASEFKLVKTTVKKKDTDLAKIEVKWPNIKMSGSAASVERSKSPEIGVKGDFTLAFAPLFGISGEIDVIQVLLSTMGGPFGRFLRNASQMSIGELNEKGELDTSKPYIDTNLELKIGATASVDGAVSFMAEGESLWAAATADSKLSSGESGGTGISGIVGLILTGTALVKGMVWDVNFALGGEFKTTDESGAKPSGFEVNLKPAVIHGSYTAIGTLEFTGLAIVYALYKRIGGAGTEDKQTGKKAIGRKSKVKKSHGITQKSERKAVLFKRKPLLSNNKDTVSLDAYKTTS